MKKIDKEKIERIGREYIVPIICALFGVFGICLFLGSASYVFADIEVISEYAKNLENVGVYSGLDVCIMWGYIFVVILLPYYAIDCFMTAFHAHKEGKRLNNLPAEEKIG